jgi:isocitrate dehydrogenase
MRQPSAPGNGPNTPRPRGAIRTHLGRKRSGARGRAHGYDRLRPGELDRRAQEDLFDRLLHRFQALFEEAGEKTASAFDSALDRACDTLVTAGEFTVDNAERLRQYLRRDLLQRDHPAMTFRTGDITSAGTLTCENCGWTIQTTRTTLLPSCPQCGETSYRKTG